MASLVVDDLEDIPATNIAQAINGGVEKDDVITSILSADALTPGLATEAVRWFIQGWSWDDLSKKFQQQALDSGRPRLGRPQAVASTSKDIGKPFRMEVSDLSNWAVASDWDEPLRLEKDLQADSVSI
jgi:hypothetical protein